MYIAPDWQPVFRAIGLDAEAVFDHPDIRVWRSIPERENGTLEVDMPQSGNGPEPKWQGRPGPESAAGRRCHSIRLHIKRHRAGSGAAADQEARGIQLLQDAGIAAAPLVAWGRLDDGRSFVITQDLAGYEAGDKFVERGGAFERILEPTAKLAAALHKSGLHHRDLYLCHFFVRVDESVTDVCLIDAARVRRLPNWLLRGRWIVKDLAQFWYSTLALPVTNDQREKWLACYARERGSRDATLLQRRIERKSAWIGRHDRKLRAAQPARNISIPR